MTLGNRMRTLRAEKSYTQEYIAEQLQVSRQAVSKWENDVSSPDTKNLIRLAELFEVSVAYLTTGNEAPGIKREGKITKYVILQKTAYAFFMIALVSHSIGFFSGEFTKPLIPIFPYLWYGTSVWAVVLNVFTVFFTIGWITLLIIAGQLKKNNPPEH